ncbi:MAG: ATP-binding protein [Elusimicrobiota bacterium]
MNPLRSLAAKLSLLTSLFTLGVLALVSQGIFRQIEQGLIGEMRVRAEFFSRSAREALFPKPDLFSLHFHVEELLKEKAVTYAAVVDSEGRVVSHSDPRLIGEVLDDLVSARALAAEETLLQRRPDATGASYELAVPLRVGNRRVGTARLGFDESSIQSALQAQKRRLLTLATLVALVTILGTVSIVGWITRPLPRLAAAAREIALGKFDVRVDWRSRDEIGLLAKSFNDMAAANSVLFAAINQEKEKLATIVHETREGMVWTDAQGGIRLINPAARALLGCGESPPDGLASALTGFESRPALATVIEARARITAFEFHRQEPKLLILSGVADRLGSDQEPAGLLFIFHDATLEKRGESIARNFLSIVSHKLRTPLAVALGYLDILLSGENLDDSQRKALVKIQQEDQKLHILVEKLIIFSLAQSPENIVLDRGAVDLTDVVDEALKSLGERAAGPGVRVRWAREEAAGLPGFAGDRVLLRQAVANLVENAIKFNTGPKKEVRISASLRGSGLRVSVQDNGPGIPSEEHPKLFRKFYQIDDDFTGQIPGFGLGLAFVKNVVEAHGGTAGMTSIPGGGSEFYFDLPLAAP